MVRDNMTIDNWQPEITAYFEIHFPEDTQDMKNVLSEVINTVQTIDGVSYSLIVTDNKCDSGEPRFAIWDPPV